MNTYEAPSLSVIGTVHDVTQQQYNKCGLTPDFISEITSIVGEQVPVPPDCPAP